MDKLPTIPALSYAQPAIACAPVDLHRPMPIAGVILLFAIGYSVASFLWAWEQARIADPGVDLKALAKLFVEVMQQSTVPAVMHGVAVGVVGLISQRQQVIRSWAAPAVGGAVGWVLMMVAHRMLKIPAWPWEPLLILPYVAVLALWVMRPTTAAEDAVWLETRKDWRTRLGLSAIILSFAGGYAVFALAMAVLWLLSIAQTLAGVQMFMGILNPMLQALLNREVGVGILCGMVLAFTAWVRSRISKRPLESRHMLWTALAGLGWGLVIYIARLAEMWGAPEWLAYLTILYLPASSLWIVHGRRTSNESPIELQPAMN
jgi:hypothetical protein